MRTIPKRIQNAYFQLKKSRLMDFVDWGFGYKHFRGTELTHLDYTNALGEVTSSVESKGNFTNGFLYGRFSAHSLIYIGKKKIDVTRKYFIDNAIGFNFDYNLIADTYCIIYNK